MHSSVLCHFTVSVLRTSAMIMEVVTEHCERWFVLLMLAVINSHSKFIALHFLIHGSVYPQYKVLQLSVYSERDIYIICNNLRWTHFSVTLGAIKWKTMFSSTGWHCLFVDQHWADLKFWVWYFMLLVFAIHCLYNKILILQIYICT